MIDPGNRLLPYIANCQFCEQGTLRFARCHACQQVAAICDECELAWQDIAGVSDNPSLPSSAAYPTCPACKQQSEWNLLSLAEVQQADLTSFVAGESR